MSTDASAQHRIFGSHSIEDKWIFARRHRDEEWSSANEMEYKMEMVEKRVMNDKNKSII